METEKIGLVLEGGGMRGVYTAGVLDAFLEAGLEFDGCLGVSAGSCHGASFLSRQKGRAFRINVDYLDDWRYCGVRSWLTTGDFFGAKMLYDTIPNQLDPYDYAAFEKRKGWFRAVVTNVESGKAEYPLLKDMKQDVIWLRASSSLPLLSRIVKVNCQGYLDGGISDSIPIEAAMRFGCRRNVVVLTQCPEYRKKPNSLMPLIQLHYRKYPRLVSAMRDRHLHYNAVLKKLQDYQANGLVYLIQPNDPVTIGRLEKDRGKLTALYEIGKADGLAHLPQLKRFLSAQDENSH